MEYEKDYSLLRPFDLEAAKRGEAVCFNDRSGNWTFVVGPDVSGNFILQCEKGRFYLCSNSFDGWRMAPLAWVEGKPVYLGEATWTPHKVKSEVKLLAYLINNELRWFSGSITVPYHTVRVPSEDKVVELED